MAAGIFRRVLPLAEGVALRLAQDSRAMLPGMFAMAIHVSDTHMHLVACVGIRANVSLRQDNRAIAKDQLCAVVAFPASS